ncbi:tetratricopeptide repeat protein [Streptomyces europaeiscabiei]|uniref:tetratricopeptide repeat protein n=1 Tax=Streptomyces europaeiscabiei TaxID=146819 RepID=UPI0029B9888C|nr:tetratricopeptide repeat protein [Streptomyces europaeiscabiei]MDX3695693.1 tetratricopeptide repeat protein [Streptomyces europaeiscabiei]
MRFGQRPPEQEPEGLRRGQWVADSTVYGSVVLLNDVAGDVSVNLISAGPPLYRVEAFPVGRRRIGPVRARSQPARLLHPDLALVPFVGRRAELAKLSAWRDQDETVSVCLLHGPGGQGKTRLARQFAEAAQTDGWRVFRATHASEQLSAPSSDAEAASTGRQGTLIVVDYSERWPASDLQELLNDALRQRVRTRVLLIARPAGTWWSTLSNNLDRAEIDSTHVDLGPMGDDPDARLESLFTSARDHFAAALGIPAVNEPGLPAAVTEHRGFRQVLAVHMAALALVDAHDPARHGMENDVPVREMATPEEVSAYLLARERAYWEALSIQGRVRVTADALGQTAYTAVLTRAQPYAAGLAAVARTAVESTEPGGRVLKDHAVAYPPSTRTAGPARIGEDTVLEPLYPDRLAEDFLALCLPGHAIALYPPDLWAGDAPQRLLTDTGEHGSAPAPEEWARTALTALIAAADRWPHLAARQLTPLLLAHPQLAVQAGGAALTALAQLPDLDPAVLEAVEPHLPDGLHIELGIAAAEVTARLTTHRLARSDDPAVHAELYEHLGRRQWQAGLDREALEPTERAVETVRALAAADPATHQPALVRCLTQLGAVLSDLGHAEEALAATQEAVRVARDQGEQYPDAEAADLTTPLCNLCNHMLGAGRPREALEAGMRAAEIYGRFHDTNPDQARPDFARTLVNVGIVLSEEGHREDAVSAGQAAVNLYLDLAVEDPAQYKPALATALNTLADHMWRAGDPAAAVRSVLLAVQIRRGLVEANPGLYRQALAIALTGCGVYLAAVGRLDKAVDVEIEAVDLWRDLAALNPRRHRRFLAISLSNLSNRLAKSGRLEESLTAIEEAVALHHEGVRGHPYDDNRLASALTNLGNRLAEAGRTRESVATAEKAVGMFRRLVADHGPAHRPDLAHSLANLGAHQADLGQYDQALETTLEAVRIQQELAAENPKAHEGQLALYMDNAATLLGQRPVGDRVRGWFSRRPSGGEGTA